MKQIRQHYSFIKIHTGSDLSKRRIPYMSIKSETKGPLIWFTGCMHGDEIGGTVIIHELFKKLKKQLLKGTVQAFPLMNPSGFESTSRHIAISQEDLNRSFPGNEKGTLAERIAAKIFSQIVNSKPALVVDLHNDWNKSIPYALLDPLHNSAVDQQIRQVSEFSGLLQIEDTDIIQSSLTFNLIKNNIPALVLELGESYIINEKNIEIGLNAIWNILVEMKMVSTDEKPYRFPLPDSLKNKVLKYSCYPLSSTSGIVRFLKRPGELISKGQRIAKVYNAFGKQVETVTSIHNGIVIGHADQALAFPGSAIMAFGVI